MAEAAFAVVAFIAALVLSPFSAIPNWSVCNQEMCAAFSSFSLSLFLPFSAASSVGASVCCSVPLSRQPAINHGRFVCCFLLPVISHLFSIFICPVTHCYCCCCLSSSSSFIFLFISFSRLSGWSSLSFSHKRTHMLAHTHRSTLPRSADPHSHTHAQTHAHVVLLCFAYCADLLALLSSLLPKKEERLP